MIAVIFAGLPLLFLIVLLLALPQSEDIEKLDFKYQFMFGALCLILLALYVISAVYNLVGVLMRRRLPIAGLILNVLTFAAWFIEENMIDI